MRCSFEETVKILMEAAAVGEKDNCHSITENIMFGHMAPMGTRAFEVEMSIRVGVEAFGSERNVVEWALVFEYTTCLISTRRMTCKRMGKTDS